MSKVLKKRINIKRKESLNKKLLTQIMLSIFLIVAVIITKHFGNSYTGVYLDNAKEKISETINFKALFNNINSVIKNIDSNVQFAAPVSGKIYKKYGINETDDSKEYNHGIDIISNMESVKAIANGKVTDAGENPELSKYIVIESGSKKIIYAMFEEIFVDKNDEIKLGDIIGRLNSEDRFLHLEVWENGESLNPSKLFKLYE